MADSTKITGSGLRSRFAETRLPEDPTSVVMPAGSENWPRSMRDQLSGTLKPAGVLVPLIERRTDGVTVLLTERSAELKHHAGQVSFPGGRMETGDADIAATALRETHEEVGIARERVAVIGYLDTMPTITGYAVTPVVGLVDEPTEFEIDTSEVRSAFEVPLEFLLDPGNRQIRERELHGRRVPMAEFHYAGQRIWGATAMIILELIKYIRKQ